MGATCNFLNPAACHRSKCETQGCMERAATAIPTKPLGPCETDNPRSLPKDVPTRILSIDAVMEVFQRHFPNHDLFQETIDFADDIAKLAVKEATK